MSTHRQHKQEEHPWRDSARFHAQFGSGLLIVPPSRKNEGCIKANFRSVNNTVRHKA